MRVFALLFIMGMIIVNASEINISEVKYTESIEQFKKDNQRGRMEVLLGCWLMSREYSNDTNVNYRLGLIKKCMRKISRKDSVVKITSLIGKNMSMPKKYDDIVAAQDIASMAWPSELNEFDNMLLDYIKGYERDLSDVQIGKESEELKKKMDVEMEKRQKYYFGFIPASKFSQLMIFVCVTIFMITMCSCWKYYNKKSEKEEEKKESGKEKLFNHCQNHSHHKTSSSKVQKPKRF